jgi:DTW domain-containing protein YfiP
MDKAAYLERKRAQAGAASFGREHTCYTCWWPRDLCLCPRIKPFPTATRFVILMHPKEAKREKYGTGRICHAALPDSRVLVGVDFTEDPEVNALLADPRNLCMVLYPGKASLNVSTGDVAPLLAARDAGRRLVVFLIDGTWQCAKKMMTQSRNVRGLPRISFTPAGESIFEIKEQPAPYCLSTLESIHRFLDEADRRGLERLPGRPHDNLLAVFREMIDFALRCAQDPEKASYRRGPRGYSPRASRRKRVRKHGRNILLLD